MSKARTALQDAHLLLVTGYALQYQPSERQELVLALTSPHLAAIQQLVPNQHVQNKVQKPLMTLMCACDLASMMTVWPLGWV